MQTHKIKPSQRTSESVRQERNRKGITQTPSAPMAHPSKDEDFEEFWEVAPNYPEHLLKRPSNTFTPKTKKLTKKRSLSRPPAPLNALHQPTSTNKQNIKKVNVPVVTNEKADNNAITNKLKYPAHINPSNKVKENAYIAPNKEYQQSRYADNSTSNNR